MWNVEKGADIQERPIHFMDNLARLIGDVVACIAVQTVFAALNATRI